MPKKLTEEAQKVEQKVVQVSEEVWTKILDELKALREDVSAFKTSVERPITSKIEAINDQKPQVAESTPNPDLLPVPSEYRNLVDTVLNKDFGLELVTRPDAALITATVIVPSKYSTATAEQLAVIGGRDIRPKVLTTAGGINELKEWVEQVFRSFSPELQALIVADRTK